MQNKKVSREEWTAARLELLKEEKALTRQMDQVRNKRMALPWVKVEKEYVFDGPGGKVTLSDLFNGRSQLFVQHFMFGPEWDEGCVGCSFKADHVDAAVMHLHNHDVTFVAVSRAPLDRIAAFKKRMNWQFDWVSSAASDFNYDYQVSYVEPDSENGKVYHNYELQDFAGEEQPGTSVFYKDADGVIYHTYSTYGRGDELLVGAYMYLDMTPLGRNEHGEHGNLMDWVKHHDKYPVKTAVDASALYKR